MHLIALAFPSDSAPEAGGVESKGTRCFDLERREKQRPFAGVETESSRQRRGKRLWAATGAGAPPWACGEAIKDGFVGTVRGAACWSPKMEWGVTNSSPSPGHERAVAVRFPVRKVSHS